jgi:hypothetical protein
LASCLLLNSLSEALNLRDESGVSRVSPLMDVCSDDLLLGILDHLVNLSARQSSNRVLDGDVSLSARGLVLGRNLDYEVGRRVGRSVM